MPVGYDNSGNEDAVNNFIRAYSTNEILKSINEESNKIFNDKGDLPGAERVTYTVYNKSKSPIEQPAIIQSWSLIDLAYYAIIYSNDYRGKSIEKKDELYFLSVAVDHMKQRKEHELLERLNANTPELMFYLWGFGGEQFKFETINKVFDNQARDLYIIFESSKKCEKTYEFDQVIQFETGFSWKEIVTFLLIGWFGYTQYNTLTEIIETY